MRSFFMTHEAAMGIAAGILKVDLTQPTRQVSDHAMTKIMDILKIDILWYNIQNMYDDSYVYTIICYVHVIF